ncbi:MAG: polymer-forming cytoskeletal protein [Bacteroidetes bacterium]|nr:polymer-forming cytoskeletal protein [Bacteroidota bacterium]MBS1757109.1 polymer-forming cytoskeletal protein [Bacteroidota bacterium]
MFTSKKKSENDDASLSASSSIIGAGTTITGNIDTAGDLRIDGTLKGNIQSKAKLLVGAGGCIEGSIYCRQADIMGQVTGNITATELLQLKGKATVSGDIQAAKLLIESTVNYNGTCQMGANIVELKPEVAMVVNE